MGKKISTTNVSGSRNLNLNNYVWNTNWNNGFVAACDKLDIISQNMLRQSGEPNKGQLFTQRKRINKEVHKTASTKWKTEDDKLKRSNKNNNLMEKITDINNIRKAFLQAKKGNTKSPSYMLFKENYALNLYNIQQKLISGQYKIGDYYSFPIRDPKLRIISALPFKDRVVQHAINNIIEPIFEKVFYSSSYACRKNKGTHNCVKNVQACIRRIEKNTNKKCFALKMDFSKYFNSINTKILLIELYKKIKDKELLKILVQFMDEIGIRVGNLLSQLFANIYGHIFDRFIKTKLHIKNYFRYMDDTVILDTNKMKLYRTQKILKKFSGIYMKLKFSKWYVVDIEEKSLNFVGYRIRKNYKLVRKISVLRAKRKVKKYTLKGEFENLRMFLSSWKGHIEKADSFNLKRYIKKEFKQWKMEYQVA